MLTIGVWGTITLENYRASFVDNQINFIGTSGSDSHAGNEGNDFIDGLAGNDTLRGNAGEDYIRGGDGNDTLDGGTGNDILSGDADNDTIHGGDGRDYMFGGDGNDSLTGGEGNDRLRGSNGNDTLVGGAGNDYLNGGNQGDDIFVFAAGHGHDEIDIWRQGGDNRISLEDAADFDDIQIAYEANRSGHGEDATITWAGGTITVTRLPEKLTAEDFMFGDAVAPDAEATLPGDDEDAGQDSGSETTTTSDANETIAGIYWTGTADDERFDGGAGNDALQGARGDDTISGLGGNDTLHGGWGDDTLNGGVGIDSLYGGAGRDELDGGAENDFVAGGSGNDVLKGGEGDDTLIGWLGDDTLEGGDGNDRFEFEFDFGFDFYDRGFENNIITDFEAGDEILLEYDGGAGAWDRVVFALRGGESWTGRRQTTLTSDMKEIILCSQGHGEP